MRRRERWTDYDPEAASRREGYDEGYEAGRIAAEGRLIKALEKTLAFIHKQVNQHDGSLAAADVTAVVIVLARESSAMLDARIRATRNASLPSEGDVSVEAGGDR